MNFQVNTYFGESKIRFIRIYGCKVFKPKNRIEIFINTFYTCVKV